MADQDYRRPYPLLSVCGLNCGLCPRFHTEGSSRCPGCCGEHFLSKRPSCGVISCSRRKGDIEYCFLCDEYPCSRYENAQCVDSFISHRNMLSDFQRAKEIGIEAYRSDLDEKVAILRCLLTEYNDGRRKSFYCQAVNLLALRDLREIMERIAAETAPEATAKEKAVQAVVLLQERADSDGIDLTLLKKEKGTP